MSKEITGYQFPAKTQRIITRKEVYAMSGQQTKKPKH